MTIDVASALLRAGAHLDDAAKAADRGFKVREPVFFRKDQAEAAMRTHFATAVEHGRRALRELEGIGAPAEDARAGVASAIASLDPTRGPTRSFERTLVLTSRWDIHHQDAHRQLRLWRDRLRLQAELGPLPAGVGKQRMQAEVDGILALPDAAITKAQVRRVGVAAALPEHLRPKLGAYRATGGYAQWDRDGSFELVALRGGTTQDSIVETVLHNARLDVTRRNLAADTGVNRSMLDTELRRIIAKPIAELTQADQDRLSVMAGLGDELRPALLDTRLPWPYSPLDQLATSKAKPEYNDPLRGKIESLRVASEVESLLADPSLTRQSVARELVQTLTTPPTQLSEESLRRMSVLMRLPEHLRPASPHATYHHYGIEDLGLLGPRFQPPRNTTAAQVWAAERVPLLAEVAPEVLVKEIRDGIAHGNLTPHLVAAAGPDVLRQAGLDPGAVYGNALAELARELTGAGTAGRNDVASQLSLVRTHITTLKLEDPRHVELQGQLLELIDRNLARLGNWSTPAGVVRGYANHPDYAEIGRIVASGRLLHAIVDDSRPAARAAAAADTPAEMLRW